MTEPGSPLISICVCTYRRPEGLRHLLDSLRRITVPASVSLELLVVDNDRAASARELFEQRTADWPWPARYVVEPRLGVGYARGRCVEEARGEWVAYIDDDEWAEPQWLDELWRTRVRLDADGVFGPVLASFVQPPGQALLRSGIYERRRAKTGSSMAWQHCASGNVLFRKQLFRDAGGFDPAFAQSGSEDVDFFWRCLDRGARFVWSDEALAHESIPPLRTTLSYVRQRAYREGQNYVRLHARRYGQRSYLSFALRGLLIVAILTPLVVGGRLLGFTEMFLHERKLFGGLGKLRAAWTPASREYGSSSVTPPDSKG